MSAQAREGRLHKSDLAKAVPGAPRTGGRVADSFWVYHIDLACCGQEVEAAAGPRFDWERLGCRLVADHRNADVMFVTGPITPAMAPEIQRVYREMRAPKYVVAVGSCASTGGMYAVEGPHQLQGLGAYVPVDLFVPGCAPRPESLIHAILRLQEKAGALRA